MFDQFGRQINYMRISVTDRCNMRCVYCLPAAGIDLLPHGEILTYNEILRIVKAAAFHGISAIKVTGGEPLVRKDITELIRQIKNVPGIREVTMTTNGLLFKKFGENLAAIGLDGINFSLDTMNPVHFSQITRVDALEKVKDSIELALRLGLKTKINCVPIPPYHYDDLANLAGYARNIRIDVRFIEMMPIGIGKNYYPLESEKLLEKLSEQFGEAHLSGIIHGNGPARYYDFPGFKGSIGFISPISHEFCGSCNRIRLTASGALKQCLCFNKKVELKPLLRSGISDSQLNEVIRKAIFEKPRENSFCRQPDESSEKKIMAQIGG